jgi:hypothetical protein
MTSYNTLYGDPGGRMPGTHVRILEELEVLALNNNSRKVYWFVGMMGMGKSMMSQSLCQILNGINLLGASFFAPSNPRFINHSIAYVLARGSLCLLS